MASAYEKTPISAVAHLPVTPLPPGWLAMQDPLGSGKVLYYNASTGRTSYARPVIRILPPGWVRSQTPDGKTIFVHIETQRCSLEWPQEAATVQPQQVQMPQLSRHITTPGNATAPSRPDPVRSQTAPVRTPQSPPMVTLNINSAAARKAVPGFEEAYAVHQLSERNNTQVLSQRFNSDLAQTTSAMREVTISGAAVATRSAKVVGQTLASRKKMAKVSKKILVHTGALGVKTGRAVKGVMGEMVDAADQKGKYQPKVRTFVPYDGQAQPQVVDQVHAYEYQHHQQMVVSQPQLNQQISGPSPAPTPVPAKIPARKPVRPFSVSIHPSMSNQASINLQAAWPPNNTVLPTTSVGPPAVAPAAGLVSQLSSSAAATTVEAGGASSHIPVVETAVTMDPTPQILAAAQGNQDPTIQFAGDGTVQVLQQPAPVASLPSNSLVASTNLQQVQPPQPNVGVPQHHISPSLSIQAQGSLTIATSTNPPSYAQATAVPVATTATIRPARRPLPQSVHAPLLRPVTVQRPPPQPQTGPQYTTALAADPTTVQYITHPQEQIVQYQAQQVVSAAQPPYGPAQPFTAGSQPVVIEQNQSIIQQSTNGQDLMLAQMQMQMAQQSAADQLLLQQNANVQSMMLARSQVTSAQQPVLVDQNIYVDQSQQVDVTNFQETNMTAYTDYGAATEVVTFADTGYEEAYVTGTAGEELVFADETSAAGDYYEVEYEIDAADEIYGADLGVEDTEVAL
ncbi:hypothetical protein H2200_002961 [Cladophialophora chaetospira]|uniref:WW domain-containing protein n=1 Tax=Cladophialophora chaetospira TaxID=386627 RepID=A0AA38XGG2_9EURO|nr:hypothetical protein H2200_002961 [Cladophialophora chaetospira]